ncbi:MAG: nitrogen regulation protein NR(II) [Planctomycetota bacterium]
MRIALHFALLFSLLAVALGFVAVSLVGRAVEDRIHDQLRDTVRLADHLPLSNQTAEQLSRYIHAEVVVTAGKKVQLSSLNGKEPPGFEAFPAEKDVTIHGTERSLVAASRLSDGRTLYLVYPRELETAERERAARPVVILSVVGVLVTALLGALKERSVVRERTRALERLVSALAHEVKNPLGAIRLTVETLREGARDDREREAFDVVTSEVERLALLVDQLRLLGGPQRFVPAPVDVGETLGAVLALLHRTFEHRGLSVVRAGEAPPALVDPRALKQAVLNLLLNALEASPRGGKITARLSADLARGMIRLDVSDEGPGVPPEARAHLFEPFYTTKEGGTGLGLALARRVAVEHGGSLALSDSARGATFVLELPRA